MMKKNVSFDLSHPTFIPIAHPLNYGEICLYNNDAMLRKINQMRMERLLNPILNQTHRQKMWHYIYHSSTADDNNSSVSSV